MSATLRNALRSTGIAVVIYLVIEGVVNAVSGGAFDVASLLTQLVIFAVVVFTITFAMGTCFGGRVRPDRTR